MLIHKKEERGHQTLQCRKEKSRRRLMVFSVCRSSRRIERRGFLVSKAWKFLLSLSFVPRKTKWQLESSQIGRRKIGIQKNVSWSLRPRGGSFMTAFGCQKAVTGDAFFNCKEERFCVMWPSCGCTCSFLFSLVLVRSFLRGPIRS